MKRARRSRRGTLRIKSNRRNKSRRRFRKQIGSAIKPIPVFIISYNQYTYLKSMIEQLSKYPSMSLNVIDNKSTYPPLIEYLKQLESDGKVRVLYQPENYGHKVYERDEIVALGGDKYIVTDPDLLLNPNIPNNFVEILSNISDKYKANKVGFALDIKNNINMNRKIQVTNNDANVFGAAVWKKQEGKTIQEMEADFWKQKIDDPDYELYRAPIDTTFALINKAYYKKGSMENCIRVAGDFTAVHRTWLNGFEKDFQRGEYEHYLGKGNKSSTAKLLKVK